MKKKIPLILIGILIVQFTFAQSNKLPVQKYGTVGKYSALRYYLDEFNFEYTFGYSNTKFANQTFGEQIDNSNIKQIYGYYFNVRYNKLLPFILELGYTSSLFEQKNVNYFNFNPKEKINFNGVEINTNFVLLPASKFFIPYIGLGYGFYKSNVGAGLFNKNDRYFSENVNNPFFKTGFSINFHEMFYINAEYKQSLSINKPFDFSQLNAGVGFRLYEDFMYINHRDYFEYLPIDYSFGFSYTKFNNQEYIQSSKNSDILNLYGYYFNLRYTKLLPLIFDVAYTNSVFKTNSDYFKFNANEQISFNAFEGGLNLTIPNVTFLLPYVGIGFGHYVNSVGKNVFDINADRIYENSSDEAFWKIGLTINTGSSFFFNTEYKQTFNRNKEFAFNQLNAGIGFRIETENIFLGNVKDDFDESGVIISYGYHQTNFLNYVFNQHLKNGDIQKEWGNVLNLRITASYPLMIDLAYFSSQFTVKDVYGWQNTDTTRVRHRGGELALSLPLLSATRYFIPYIGAGYQFAQLYVGPPVVQTEGVDYSDIVVMSKNTFSPIYKLGVMLNFNIMSYSVEYKHSFINNKLQFYQLSVNLGLKI